MWLSCLVVSDCVTQVTIQSVFLSGLRDSSNYILTVALSGLCEYPVCCSFRQCDSSDYYLLFCIVWLSWLSCLLFFLVRTTQVTILSVVLSGLCDSREPSLRGLQAGLEQQRRSLHRWVCRLWQFRSSCDGTAQPLPLRLVNTEYLHERYTYWEKRL